MKQKSLVILTPGFPASEDDSSCLPLQQALTRALHDQYPMVKIHVISFQYPYKFSVYNCAGATVHSFGNKNRGHLFALILRKKIFQKLISIHQKENLIGILSLWYGECAFVGQKFSKIYGLPHYCWLLGQDARPGNKHPGKARMPADNLVAISDTIRKEFFKNYSIKPATVITPGVESIPVSLQEEKRDIDILGVGSLISLKQFDIFLDIIHLIKCKVPDVKCMIVGEGPEKQNLLNKIIKNELQSNVLMSGELPHAKVLELMSRTKVLLHTSSYEGFSGVCMEALSRAAFVLSFVKPMNTDIDQWHIADDKPDMIHKLGLLLERNDHRSVLDFPIEKTATQIMELFDKPSSMVEKTLLFSLKE